MTNSNRDNPIHTIQSEANSIFDNVLNSFAETIPDSKKALLLGGIFEKSEKGYLPRASVNDLTGMLSPLIASIQSLGDDKEVNLAKSSTVKACLFCWNALREESLGETNKAWLSLVQASYFLGIVRGSCSHNEAINQNSKEAASLLAKFRHMENYQLAKDAITYWRANISPDLSAQKAATELTRVVPLSHKKLAELVSAEKKK